MSRIELHCPSCGYDVPPTLLQPPSVFMCPGCNEETPRDKLTRLKVLHRNIAGPAPAAFDVRVLGMGSFYDASAVTTVLTVTNCLVNPADLVIICVAASPNTTNATPVTIGGQTCTQIVAGGGGDPDTDVYFRQNIRAGLKTASVTFAVGQSAAAAVVLGVAGIKTVSPNDQSNGQGTVASPSTHFDSLATPALTSSGQFVVGLASQNLTVTTAATKIGAGFAFLARAGTSQSSGSPPDIFIDVAWKASGDLNPVQFTGDFAVSNDWSAGVATFFRKP